MTAGAHGGGAVPLDVRHLYLNRITVIGSAPHGAGDMDASLRAAAEGRCRATIDRIMPLEEAAEAHRIVAAGEGLGKVVLVPPGIAPQPAAPRAA